MAEINQSLTQLKLEPANTKNLKSFVGELNGNIKILEKGFGVKIFQNGNKVSISGDKENIKKLQMQSRFICYQHSRSGTLQGNNSNGDNKNEDINPDPISSRWERTYIKTPKKVIKPRGKKSE